MDEQRLTELSERLSQLNSEQLQTALAEEQSVLTLPEVDEILVIASIFRGEVEDLQSEVRRLQALVDEYEMGHRVPVGRAYNRGGL